MHGSTRSTLHVMAHSISERRMRERIRALAPEIGRQLRREARHARRIVELWNKRAERGLKPSFFPTIETALRAEMPILDVLCPACQTVGSVDIRKLDCHRGMAISSLIRDCRAGCAVHIRRSRG